MITCKYCGAEGTYRDIHRDGWVLAKNHPFAYVCFACRPKDEEKKNAKS